MRAWVRRKLEEKEAIAEEHGGRIAFLHVTGELKPPDDDKFAAVIVQVFDPPAMTITVDDDTEIRLLFAPGVLEWLLENRLDVEEDDE